LAAGGGDDDAVGVLLELEALARGECF